MKALSSGNFTVRLPRASSRGVATLELLIAFAILMLSMTAVILVVFGNQSISIDTQINNEAVSKSRALIETARALSRQDFNAVVSIASTTDGIYEKNLTVEILDASTKQVTSTVAWNSLGRTLAVRLTTLLTNPTVGDACSATLNGDWTEPSMISYEFGKDLLVPSDASSAFPITSVQVAGSKLFVTVDNPASNNKATFFGFDISNPAAKPIFLFGVDNAPTISEGLSSVAVSSHYAYTANAYTSSRSSCTAGANCAQLQIFDTDSPATPPVNLKIPVTTSGGNLAYGTSIFYSKGYVYIGLAKASGSGAEFYVVDVGGGGAPASPTNPILKGNYPVGNGVNALYVKDNYAYIASPNTENVTVLDISNPQSPTRVGGYTPGTANNGKSLFVKDNIIYLGRIFGTNEFYMLNSPDGTFIKSKDIGSGSSTSINALLVREYLAFFVTNSQFQIWNTSGSVSQYATPLGLPGTGTALGCRGNYMYVGSVPTNNKGTISIIGSKSVYTLSSGGDITVAQGSADSTTITKTLVSGLASASTLSASGLPAGTSASFTNGSCTPTCTGSVTIGTDVSTPTGTYPITVAGTGGVTTIFNLVVTH